MAIFLSRIKRALNVGSKSITANGTYYASADGYDGYDEVTVNVSGGSAIPITPSNANPAALSSGVAVEPTANGYAISSYDNVTPSSTIRQVSSGNIVKFNSSGVVVDDIYLAIPSDSAPEHLLENTCYKPISDGYLYATQQGGSTETVLWTNSSPTSSFAAQTVTLSNGLSNYDYIRVKYRHTTTLDVTANVYATVANFTACAGASKPKPISLGMEASAGTFYSREIDYLTDTTVSVKATSDNARMIPLEIVGISVALPPSVGNVKVGAFTAPAVGTTISIACGFQPKKICMAMYTGTNNMYLVVYDVDMDSSIQIAGWKTSSSTNGCQQYAFPNTSNNGVISEITSTSFVYRGGNTTAAKTVYYFAIG